MPSTWAWPAFPRRSPWEGPCWSPPGPGEPRARGRGGPPGSCLPGGGCLHAPCPGRERRAEKRGGGAPARRGARGCAVRPGASDARAAAAAWSPQPLSGPRQRADPGGPPPAPPPPRPWALASRRREHSARAAFRAGACRGGRRTEGGESNPPPSPPRPCPARLQPREGAPNAHTHARSPERPRGRQPGLQVGGELEKGTAGRGEGGLPACILPEWEELNPSPLHRCPHLFLVPKEIADHREPQNGKPRCSPSPAPFQAPSLLRWTPKAAGNPCPQLLPLTMGRHLFCLPQREPLLKFQRLASSVLTTPRR